MKQKIQNRILAVLLCLCLVTVWLPTSFLTAQGLGTPVTELWVNNEDILNGGTVEGVSYDEITSTLTLNNAVIDTVCEQTKYKDGIYVNGDLNIVLKGDNVIRGDGIDYGIDADPGSITITGDGTLDVEGEYNGIFAYGNVIIGGTTDITAYGSDGGIYYYGKCYALPDDGVWFYALIGENFMHEESLTEDSPYTELSQIPLKHAMMVEGETYYPYVHIYGIQTVAEMSVSPEELKFGKVSQNYTESPQAETVTVENTGNIAIELIQPVLENYEIGELSKTVLQPGDKATFTVQPKVGLNTGNYDSKIDIYADKYVATTRSLLSESQVKEEYDILQTVNVTFSVKGNYTLSFETGGGTAIDPVTKEEGSEISLSDYVTEKDGYTFTGWYTDERHTKSISTVTLDGNKTVYAGWSEITDSAESGDSGIPITGDRTNVLPWIAMLFISGGVLTAISIKKKMKSAITRK